MEIMFLHQEKELREEVRVRKLKNDRLEKRAAESSLALDESCVRVRRADQSRRERATMLRAREHRGSAEGNYHKSEGAHSKHAEQT